MLWVGQFGIEDGQARQDSPWVGVFPEQGRVEPQEATDLFVLVEPARPGSEDRCRELAAAIGARFRERRLSLTGGILKALTAAHEDLRDWNRRSLKEHQIGAGVSCLAVRGGATADREAYLGQVAPAAAVLFRGGSLGRLQPALPEAAEPMGLHEELRPHFFRLELAEGDRLLLLTTGLAGALSDDELVEALQPEPEDTMPLLYRKAKVMPQCAALLVASLPEAAD